MTKKTQLLLGLIVLSVVDAVVPLFPVLGLVLIYVVLEKPPWFLGDRATGLRHEMMVS